MGFLDRLLGRSTDSDTYLQELTDAADASEERAKFLTKVAEQKKRKATAEGQIRSLKGRGSSKVTFWGVVIGGIIILIIMFGSC